MARPKHGPDCIACTDPTEAARDIDRQRAALAAQFDAARALRANGDAVKARWHPQFADLAPEDWRAVETVILGSYEAANVIASSALMARAHLDRIEAAHPAVRDALTEAAAS